MASQRRDYLTNLGLAAIAGFSGCLPIIAAAAAILLGLFLDNLFSTNNIFTIICIVISVPVGLGLMLWTAYRSAKTIEKRQYGTD
jgi:multisubunit Na+/H+ antiporter MnhG subunit